MQLSRSEIANIQEGKAIAKIIGSSNPSDIFVFGAVYIHAKPLAYLQLMSDIDRLKKLPGYLGVGEFSNPPQVADLDGFPWTQTTSRTSRNASPVAANCSCPNNPWKLSRSR